MLQSSWDAHGRATSGAVDPVRTGPRPGERKKACSYAQQLRDAHWRAGIVRPLPGFDEAVVIDGDEAAADEQRRKLCLIQAGSDEQRPVDFHSFRRAYNTGLAAAGVNVQRSMRTGGTPNASTPMKYVPLVEPSKPQQRRFRDSLPLPAPSPNRRNLRP